MNKETKRKFYADPGDDGDVFRLGFFLSGKKENTLSSKPVQDAANYVGVNYGGAAMDDFFKGFFRGRKTK